LTVPGSAQHNRQLEDVKNARTDPTKSQFETDFLKWFQSESDIQCSMCEEACRRQSKEDPKEGIATDWKKDKEWDASCLCPGEVPPQSDNDEQKFGRFVHSAAWLCPFCNPMRRCCLWLNKCLAGQNSTGFGGFVLHVCDLDTLTELHDLCPV